MHKVGTNDVLKIYKGTEEITDLAIGSVEVPVHSGAPVSHTYYYQMSGGSLVEMTFDGVDSYYASGLTILPVYMSALRFYKDNTRIAAETIKLEQSYGEFATIYTFSDLGEDDYLQAQHPITSISLKEADDQSYAYQVECTLAPVYIETDTSVSEMDFDGSIYSYYPDSKLCPGTTYKIKTLNTYANLVVQGEQGETNYGTAYTPDYCADPGIEINMSDFNYYESTLTTNTVSIPEGADCKPHFYYKGSDTWIDANDYEEVNLEESCMSVVPGDTIGIMDGAGNLPCGCLQITIKDDEDNTLGLQLAGEEWENDTTTTYTKAERRDCDLVLKKGDDPTDPGDDPDFEG